MKTVYIITESDYGINLDDIKVGSKYILIERTFITTGTTVYELRADNGEGISGNLNHRIKRYHGWRGTTNNISVFADGLRQIERIDYIKENQYPMNRTAKVKLSADLVPDQP